MSQQTEEKLRDFAVWYKHHVDGVTDPEQIMRFQQKAINELIWLTTYLVEDIQKLEGRRMIVLPHELHV